MENSLEKSIIERIRQLRSQYAGQRGKSKFAQDLGISASTYNYYENDRVPPIELAVKICEITGADIEWLLTGKTGEKKISGPNGKLILKLNQLLIEKPELAPAVSAFVDLLCEKASLEEQLCKSVRQPLTSKAGWIPVLGRTAAGMVHFWDQTNLPNYSQAVTELEELVKKHIGKPIVATCEKVVSVDLQAQKLISGLAGSDVSLVQVSGQEDQQIVEFVQCQKIHEMFSDSFALHVDGDSMSPRINDGDIVVVSPSVPAAQGCAAIAHIANQIGVTCKLIRMADSMVHLIPINERYPTKIIPKQDLSWALAVLCHISV